MKSQLEPCRECGHWVSKSAKACPGCGARLSHKNLTCLSIDSKVETESVKLSMAA
jgi:predicted amidophosphoribosyltransferase